MINMNEYEKVGEIKSLENIPPRLKFWNNLLIDETTDGRAARVYWTQAGTSYPDIFVVGGEYEHVSQGYDYKGPFEIYTSAEHADELSRRLGELNG